MQPWKTCWPIEGIVEEGHITVQRTARYYTLGSATDAREVWVVLHGYGQLARYFLRHFEGLEEGRLIAAPEALSRYYSDTGHTRVGATWMTREDREAEITDQAVYLNALAARLMGSCRPGTQLNVLGFSQGVATACRWTLCAAMPIHQIVLWGGTMALEPASRDLARSWQGVEVLLVHGAQDMLVGEAELQRSQMRLREAGIGYKTLHFPGGHTLDKHTLKQIFLR